MFSFELVMIRSDSLSLSSYSSWLLPPVALRRRSGIPGAAGPVLTNLRLLRPCWPNCTPRARGLVSSAAAEEREEEEGWDETSIQDSE